jgi:TolB-like protein
MLKTTKLMVLSLLVTVLSACSSLPLLKDINPFSTQNTVTAPRTLSAQSTKLCADDEGIFASCEDMHVENKIKTSEPSPNLPTTGFYFNGLGEYTQQMAAELQKDVQGMHVDAPIVVASFVHLDSSLQTTNTLGIQLAEFFINDLQQIGLPVADHKLMGTLDVNAKGDFAFSRDMEQFYSYVDIGYVLTGTMIKNSRGLIVNARLVNFKTNAVVASSSKFLPNIVVNGLM